ncbi:MAG: hypothetical protein VX583_14090 [Bdellovibrionota bacterium]
MWKVVFILMLSNLAMATTSDEEIMDMFQDRDVCTDFGVSYGFTILDSSRKPKTKSLLKQANEKNKDGAEKECVRLPEKYKASLLEKDECEAYILIHPEKANAEQLKYLSSKLHQAPFKISPKTDFPNFDSGKIPFSSELSAWEDLDEMRTEYGEELTDAGDDSKLLEKIEKEYKTKYESLMLKSLKQMKLSKTDYEIVQFPYQGCD